MPRLPIGDIDDPRLAPYRGLNRQNLTRYSDLFIAEGDKIVQRLIASRFPVASLLAVPAWADRLEPQLPADTPIYVAAPKLLEAIIGFNFHRGVLACGRRLPWASIGEVVQAAADAAVIVVCPDIQDPTNLGSIIRTSAALGCTAVVLGPGCADPLSRRVLRVSMGAALRLPLVESRDLVADLHELRQPDFQIVATVTDPAAQPLAGFQRPPRLAILLGSEGHGLSAELQAVADQRVTIPLHLGIDSLNVAVAAAVVLYHCSTRNVSTRSELRPAAGRCHPGT
jgi:tRNA G18 (ribose-2'-O)-methylase SpoU